MADYTPIPLQVQVPDPARRLSDMLNMAQAAQNYRLGQDTYDARVLNANSTASSAQSKATVDQANVQPLIQQQAAQTSSAQSKAEADRYGVGAKYQDDAQQIATGMVNDPRLMPGPNYDPNKAAEAIEEARQKMVDRGIPPVKATLAVSNLMTASHVNGGVHQALQNALLQQMSAPQQQVANTPNYQAAGSTPMTDVNPLHGQPPSTIAPKLAIDQQHQSGPDVNGNLTDFSRTPEGTFRPPAAMPSGTGAPTPQPMTAYPPGESQQTKQAREQEVLDADSAFRQGQQVHDINKTVISELDKGIDTGKLGEFNHYLATRTGYNGAGGDDANSYEMLQKMLARSAIASAQKMGPNTNAGLEAQGAANGTVAYGPATLKNIAHLNDAIQTGVDNYNHGMHAAIANGGSVFAKTKFDQQWSANANIDALKLSNAIKLGDQKQIDSVITGLGGRNSSKFNAVVKNIQNLSTLTQKGSL